MFREIGSEFYETPEKTGSVEFFLSGRTALDYIIKDIKQIADVRTASLPSYVCESVIRPFVDNGLELSFYEVYPNDSGGLSFCCCDSADVVLTTSYFGFQLPLNVRLSMRDTMIVIRDDTHFPFAFSEMPACDYSFASYRKWMGLEGIALARKHAGAFLVDVEERTNYRYKEVRSRADRLKRSYIEQSIGEKCSYLSSYKEANDILATDYSGYRPSWSSMCRLWNADWDDVVTKRRQNASVLIGGIREIEGVRLLYPELPDNAVPLFVPILIENDRDGLRKHLCDCEIYCPVHWPIPECHSGIADRSTELFNQELSLVCDQRYSLEDMNRIVDEIKAYRALR